MDGSVPQGVDEPNLLRALPLVDEILDEHAEEIGSALPAYRNHVYRGLNYFVALTGADDPIPETVLVAAAFHDLGIWSDRTFDYLAPSVRLASDYLTRRGREALVPEVTALIAEHHKLRAYRGPGSRDVELFRRADLVDVSLGAVRFGLRADLIQAVKAAFPDLGFHRMLVSLTARQFLKHPLRPLPMVRW
jgi:hypothetical protein